MAEIAATASPPADIRNRNLRAQRLIIIFGVFAITMASPVVLAGLPLRLLLKGEVHVTQDWNRKGIANQTAPSHG
ncbi:MAG TPA: hypothetical protein VE860_13850 [Chthoniobacterales bacterium]|jgi:hypothetical protein|nr:hypothetical protein [Chthoniobacterales bacterium]